MNYFRSGDYNAVCDLCGGKFKASKMRKTWDGYYVCQKDWYPRNPLDFQPKVKDGSTPSWTRPYGTDLNTSGTELTASGIIQFYNGVATSPPIPDIAATSSVIFTPVYLDGPIGDYSLTIQPGVGFTITSTSKLELSSIKYQVVISGVSHSSISGFAISGNAISGWAGL